MNVIDQLTDKNNNYAYSVSEKIVKESNLTDEWYPYFEEFAGLLNHKKSLVRNRAFAILAANAQWDDENKFDEIIDTFLEHVTDEKPITARQCIQALVIVGQEKPKYIPRILDTFKTADLTKYKDSMRPLIEKDMGAVREKLLSVSCNES